jgi:PAS domain S-box-containing protein
MAEWHWELKPTYDGLIRAIELMSCGMIVEDADGLIHYANARVLEWTGYVAEELDGQPVSMLVPEEFHTDLETERQRVLDGDLRTRLSAVQRKDGRTFPVAIAPQPFQRVDTGENAVLTILFDLGEVQTARPMGAAEDSLAADLAHVALKLQSMSGALGERAGGAGAAHERGPGSRDRETAIHQPEHGAQPSEGDLPEGGCVLPERPGRVGPFARRSVVRCHTDHAPTKAGARAGGS